MVTHSSKSLTDTFLYLPIFTYFYLHFSTYLLGFTYYLYFLYAVVKELGQPYG